MQRLALSVQLPCRAEDESCSRNRVETGLFQQPVWIGSARFNKFIVLENLALADAFDDKVAGDFSSNHK
jgi:hypothetical protein